MSRMIQEKIKRDLASLCEYRKGKVSVEQLNKNTYISTENMLPNKGGVTSATSLPNISLAQEFRKHDILVSNIRPYFKKIWKAEYDGGCSNDVLVFRAKDDCDPTFLFYLLADDNFFNYATATAKGTKMPRGDKSAIMQYSVPVFEIDTQKKIGALLWSIDQKVRLNNQINENLEQQLRSIFTELFAEKIANVETNNHLPLGELVISIDNRGKTPPLETVPTEYPIIDVRALSGDSRIVNYTNCTKYVSYETYSSWFRSGHPKPKDILISTVGSLAEIKIFLGSKGCIAQNVVGFRTRNISPYYLYQYLSAIKKDLVAYNIGSVQPSIKVTHIIKHPIYVPTKEELDTFDALAENATNTIYNNVLESECLANLRDTLLPKLMAGEIDLTEIQF